MSKASTDVNTIRYVRRMPREAYGHEEAEIVLAVDNKDDTFDTLMSAKEMVYDVLKANVVGIAPAGQADDEELVADDISQGVPISNKDTFIDEDEDAVESEPEIVEEAPKKRRGRPKKEPVVEPELPEEKPEEIEPEVVAQDYGADNDADEDVLDIGEDGDDEEVAAKPKVKTRTATTMFDTKNKSHQSLVRDVFSDLVPKWQLIAKPKLKEITSVLNETEFLDGEGDVLRSFRDQAKKLLAKAQA